MLWDWNQTLHGESQLWGQTDPCTGVGWCMALASWTFQRFTQQALMILVTCQRAQSTASPVSNPPPPPLKHTWNSSVMKKKGMCWVFSQVLPQTHYYENWSGWFVIPGTDNCSCKDFLQICISFVWQYSSPCHAFVAVDHPAYRKVFRPQARALNGFILEAVWFNVSLWSIAGLWLTFTGLYPLTDRLPIHVFRVGVLLLLCYSISFL